MKVLVYSDLQATTCHQRCYHNPVQSLQDWRVRKFYKDLKEVYDKYKCEALWDLGDTTDDRSQIPILTIDAVMEGLQQFPKSDWSIKLIGNHEQFLRSTAVHVGKMFNPHFSTVADEPAVLDGIGKFKLVLCPFPQEDDILAHWLEAVLEDHGSRPLVLLGHFQVAGCQLNNGQSLTGVPVELLKEFRLGLLGHVHKWQQLVAPSNSTNGIYYVGSPFQQNFGEANEEKRVAIVDTDTFSVQWIQLDGYPLYKTVSFEEFLATANTAGEDRLKVVLKNPEETERFYAHPLSGRPEPIYDYAGANMPETHTKSVESWTRSRNSILRRYVELNPPAKHQLALTPEETVDYGEQIASSAD
jgi:hypothetical protein